MIFVTVGSQKFQFNRLLKTIDNLSINEAIFAQIGHSSYMPINYRFVRFLSSREFDTFIDRADIVISHGGTGTIIKAIKKGKKVIAVPRLSRYGEHIDNHQVQFVRELRDLDLVFECQDCDDLLRCLIEIQGKNFKTYESKTDQIVRSIEAFLDNTFCL